jgi:ubiquinone/menaquinone biosynthesis C-methylase UbiE
MYSNWENEVKAQIKRRYAQQTKNKNRNTKSACEMGYPKNILENVPRTLLQQYSGCGYLFKDMNFNGNELILDLGSGAGLDSYLASKHLDTGEVFSLDITFEMLADQAAYNIKSICGDMEYLPISNLQVDLIISNASLNLATNKDTALREAFRVLKHNGRIVMRDLIRVEELPQEVLTDPLSFNTSLGGALDKHSLISKIKNVGFVNITISDHQPFSYLESVKIEAHKP